MAQLDRAGAVEVRESTYHDYRITVFGRDDHWGYSARPLKPDLPVLPRGIFFRAAETAGDALAAAQVEIDRLLTR